MLGMTDHLPSDRGRSAGSHGSTYAETEVRGPQRDRLTAQPTA